MKPLVSIIIPTFNRARLIGETLDSVLAQTYKNWECIVVDDGSIDTTGELLAKYIERDKRIKFFQRPKNLPKGANSCRNYGFEMSKGEFINWFDSDDLMTEDFIEIKYNAINSGDYDYSITKTKYFNSDKVEELYNFSAEDISCHNYITQKVNWLTYDTFIKRTLAQKIAFNTKLQAGQEFNYFSKLTAISSAGILVDNYVTLRRYHEDSIRGNLRANQDKLLKSIFKAHFYTYLDIKNSLKNNTKKYLIEKCTIWYFNFEEYYKYFDFKISLAICNELGAYKALNFVLANLVNLLTGKGYYFAKRARS